MADRYAINKSTLDGLADAIRAFKHTNSSMTPEQMTAAITAYTWPWMGDDMEAVTTLYDKTYLLKDTSFNGWAGSTTAKTIITSATLSAFAAEDMSQYEYVIVWDSFADLVADDGTTKKALPIMMRSVGVQEIYRRPSSWANIEADNFNGNTCTSLLTATFLRYYGTTANSATYTWSASYGIYPAIVAASISNTTSATPNITPKTPTVSARCSTTYMSVANVANLDQDNSKIRLMGTLYRVRKSGILRHIYERVANLTRTSIPTQEE